VREVLRPFRLRIALSLAMVAAEAGGEVALPYVLGRALEEYVGGSKRGLVVLAALGLVIMLLATVRRLHDVRLYARIYERASAIALEQEAGLSEKTARLNLLREVVDFFEHSLPVLVASVVVFIGTLVFLYRLSTPVFVASLVMATLIALIYGLTTRRTVVLNRGYNDEYERQVDVLNRRDHALAQTHVGLLNSWTIKLSDLDSINFALSLTLTVALQVFAVVVATNEGVNFGNVLSIVLYVFEFSATASMLPISWQEYLRLRDILRRFNPATTQ
jgi:hypothetical protein